MNVELVPAVGLAGAAAICLAMAVRSASDGGARHRLPPARRSEHSTASLGARLRAFPRVVRWGACCVVALHALLLPWPLPLVLPIAAGVAVLVRRVSATRVRQRYMRAADAEVPQLLDLLAAGSSAGLAAPLALRRATDGLRGPLASEILSVTHTVDLGARWRDELRSLTERIDLPDLRRAVAVLTRTETLGSSLEEATAELAATVRQARRAAVMERARAAPVKMLFPLVFLVLPAFLLLTVVPVLITTVQSIR
jgi:pilus assembly protein TadC